MTQTVDAGREALRKHAWAEAFDVFSGVDRDDGLSPDDLELMAQAAWWNGLPDDATEIWERVYAAHSGAGESSRAAAAAIRLAELAFRRVAWSIGAGWVARAERLLESEPESVVHAWLQFLYAANALFNTRDWDAVIGFADRAIELGQRHGDTNVQSIAGTFKGSALVRKGHWVEGLALFDEATASAVSGELDPKTACDVYCNTIAACRELADYRRAGEWTEQADRWMARQEIQGYRGACRLHRAELKRLRGSWTEAEKEVLGACQELEDFRLLDLTGEAHYELGELRLNMGDLDGAEQAFRRAYEFGKDPQPGNALLYLARDDAAEAARSIARSLDSGHDGDDSGRDQLARARLLPAQAQIAVANADLETARTAIEELSAIVGQYESPALEGSMLTARGELELAEGRLPEAKTTLERAWRLFQEIEVPFESARARVLLGKVKMASGDLANGRLDLSSARSVFERLGAKLELSRLDDVGPDSSDHPPERVTKTFLFTDIVTSTDLVDLIGDDAWEDLLRWHDRTLRETFSRHGGTEGSKLGDGFFVVFDLPSKAIDCAVAVQRRLAAHRREHGFAPWVRIGIHTAEANHDGVDYSGRGVHVAARVGAVADREQVVVTAEAKDSAGTVGYTFSEGRLVTLKGIKDPVEVFDADWR